jgi:GT2 family glycosyltransferase
MDVSIIIVNYNTREITKECLKTVFSKTQDIEFKDRDANYYD